MHRIALILTLGLSSILFSQTIKSPAAFLGYELGTQFSRHHEVTAYYRYLAEAAPERVRLQEYGQTNERRPLLLAVVSTEENMGNLDQIQQRHLSSLEGGEGSGKAIVWLSYNVHGNESVSSEASMQTIYELLTKKSDYLTDTVVIIDPCLNPDGRDRYVNWYNQYKNSPYQMDPNSKEHHEGWLTGRSNHYMFDLNRDWAWLTQVESRQRLPHYNAWMPHIHVDFHEQGVDEPYYFAPAAEPYHEVITNFQRDFQGTIGQNHARYFDTNGWFYFTKEQFDLFYPSYGDTYPTYNGSIGMTYEQGGSGEAGLGILTKIGDTLTLRDRIAHHHTTGMSTIEVASKNVGKLNSEFKKFFGNKKFKGNSYVLSGKEGNLRALAELLSQHQIQFGRAKKGTVKGFDFFSGTNRTNSTDNKALVIVGNQPRSTLVKVLFEPEAKLSDSLTYDITAWSLPYAYGLQTTSVGQSVPMETMPVPDPDFSISDRNAYAYAATWESMDDARFLSFLLTNDIRVRTAHEPFAINGTTYDRGTLLLIRSDNEHHPRFVALLEHASKTFHVRLEALSSGYVDTGKDFGSASVKMVKRPKVAILSDGPTNTLRFGEVWHFFEKQLHYPLTVIQAERLDKVDLDPYDYFILPDGQYGQFMVEKRLKGLKGWVQKGGKLIAMGKALTALAQESGFGIRAKKQTNEGKAKAPKPYGNLQREALKDAITGAIFKVQVDPSHPLGFGYPEHYFTLKNDANAFDYLPKGTVAYLQEDARPVSGFAGSRAQKKVGGTLVFGAEKHGKGKVIYLADNPLFRGFWENGKLFFANALFMVD